MVSIYDKNNFIQRSSKITYFTNFSNSRFHFYNKVMGVCGDVEKPYKKVQPWMNAQKKGNVCQDPKKLDSTIK